MTDLPVSEFLTARLKEYDPAFELRSGTAFEQLFFKPLAFILQPFLNDAARLETSQSFLKILQQESPDSYEEDAVDALASNIFVSRALGARASGQARVYHTRPLSREWPTGGAVFTGSNGKTYSNPAPYSISSGDMGAQIEDGNYYYDIPVVATTYGYDSNLAIDGLISLASDSDVVAVTNKVAISGGTKRETNRELIERARKSVAVRDLVTSKGLNATLFENFPNSLKEVQAIGHSDPEMMRDVVFNTHLGGKVDVYYKGASVEQGMKEFYALLPDYTRSVRGNTVVYMAGTSAHSLPRRNIDRSKGSAPVVEQVRPKTQARVSSLSLPPTADLSVTTRLRLGVDGVYRDVYIAGSNPAATTSNEIVARINAAFEKPVAALRGGFLELRSLSFGRYSEITFGIPEEGSGSNAVEAVFGLSPTASHTFYGDGPILFKEGVDYTFDDEAGQITRILQLTYVVTVRATGYFDGLGRLCDTGNLFVAVSAGDIVTFTADGSEQRVLSVVDANTLVLETAFTATTRRSVATLEEAKALPGLRTGEFVRILGVLYKYTGLGFDPVSTSGLSYSVRRGGIKNNEPVHVQFSYTPLTIDIGSSVSRADGTRGVRPGREDMTIGEAAFLRVSSIELIDPLTGEPTGQLLKTSGGFGAGGYGVGGYGVGASSDYRLFINSPVERFSVFEDGYIELDQGLAGLSLQVTYDYSPEVQNLHSFCRAENERVLDGDILVKHFIPAYVNGTIQYSVNSTDASVPSNDALTQKVKDFITAQRSGSELKFSDIYQVLARETDPFDRYGTFIKPFTLSAVVHNADGTITTVTGKDKLTVPTLTPKFTEKPLSPRITHWLADDITLERIG